MSRAQHPSEQHPGWVGTPNAKREPGTHTHTHTSVRKPWAGSTRRAQLPPDWQRRRQRILTRDRHQCGWCGQRATEVDHIARGNDHGESNLRAMCSKCHRIKTLAEATEARRR